jgi:hypothetical protein
MDGATLGHRFHPALFLKTSDHGVDSRSKEILGEA